MSVDAVIFDLDGTLVESERVWEAARRRVTEESGGRWRENAQAHMMGLSTPEWTQWMRDELGVPLETDEIFREVTEEISAAYRTDLPLLPGAIEAVERMVERWPLALASSSSRILIDLVLDLSGLDRLFRASVSSEEVERGKPQPDVYLAAAEKIGADPTACVAIEDSTAGIQSGAAAGMRVVAIPERDFPPSPEALALGVVTLDTLNGLTVELVEGLS